MRSGYRVAALTPLRESVLVGAVTAAVIAATLPRNLVVGSIADDAVYIALGKALASGQGYHSIFLVGAPVQLKYPAGLPLIVAGLWSVLGTFERVRIAGVVINLALLGATASLLWRIGRERLHVAALPLALFALAPLALDAAIVQDSLVVSEPYYLLGWTAALWIAYRLGEAATPRPLLAAVLGIELALTVLFRSQAVVLAPAVLLGLVVSSGRVRHAAIAALPFAAGLLAWVHFHQRLAVAGPVSTSPDEMSYWAWTPFANGTSLPRLGGFVAANSVRYWRALGAMLVAPYRLGIIAGGLWAVAVVAGAVRAGRMHAPLALSVCAAAASMLVWPTAYTRLLTTLLPVAGLLAAYRVHLLLLDLGRRLPGLRPAAVAALVGIAALIAAGQVHSRLLARAQLLEDSTAASYSPSYVLGWASRYIERATPLLDEEGRPGDRVLADWPAAFYLRTGLQTIGANPGTSPFLDRPSIGPIAATAERIVSNGITLVLSGHPDFASVAAIASIRRQCPASLLPLRGGDLTAPPQLFRVGERACLSRLAQPALRGDGGGVS